MNKTILSFLKSYKKKIVALSDLEELFYGDTEYEKFAVAVIDLVNSGILKPVKPHETNNKSIPLANVFRINKTLLNHDLLAEIERYHFKLHPQIMLDHYYAMGETIWRHDLPYIRKIDQYLKDTGLPVEETTRPERSYQMVGDEKWIDEKGGKKVLERLGLWGCLKISSVPDPLMLAVNPANFKLETCWHLIVENKTAFFVLRDTLPKTRFVSLVYGAGWKIVSNALMLEKQLHLTGREQRLLYFGDLDYEGISIWYALNEKRKVKPAIEFYQALLEKPLTKGKENQQKNKEALDCFLKFFPDEDQRRIIEVLNCGGYYPQEGLGKSEIQNIWRRVSCT
ncbi:MAG: DUF2220 family protein [Syntrophomonadaceae bacterium]|nr:DUF2220 family protein [Syntrophomonadaceae bacterium]MDD4549674.1 DUF2220 family protein [Syntrophomonadaceae bacterium]